MIYLKLFWSFLQIGLLSIGGGYAALPLIQERIVEKNNWLTMETFTDLITISEMTPGPIAINSATFVGMRVAGIPGAIATTIGLVLPAFIIVITLAYFYNRFVSSFVMDGILTGLRPIVVALIGSAGLSITFTVLWEQTRIIGVLNNLKNIDVFSLILFLGSIVILRRFKPNPILVMLGCGVLGVLFYMFA
ncbi:MAG TPA: chromate transporter [Clostridiaceae bacterium]|jgi:chromate transporter|nr:chromate transporter [Clostridiaceae bacterium]